MKIKYTIILLLLIPVAYAQEDILSARKASLDLNANQFISQMNLVVGFAQNKSINTGNLTQIKASFEAKLNEALTLKTIDELKSKEKEMKEIAKTAKTTAKTLLKEYIIELRNIIKTEKGEFKDKITILNNQRKNILFSMYNRRISEIQKDIEEINKTGKEPRVQKLLIKEFQKAKTMINETESSAKLNGKDLFAKTVDGIKTAFNFLVEKTKMVSKLG